MTGNTLTSTCQDLFPQRFLVAPRWIRSPSTDIPARVSTSAKLRPGFSTAGDGALRTAPVTAIVGAGGDGDARQGHAGQVR
jgi:hypothetical protein